MKSSKLFFFILFLFTSLNIAQNKTFTNEDVVINSYTSLAPTRLRGLQWIPKTNDYSYVQKNGEIFNLVRASASSGKLYKLFSQLEFNNLLKQAGLDEMKRLPNFKWIDKDNLQFRIGNKFYNYNPITSSINLTAKANDKSSNIFFAPNKKYIAFTEKNNLFFSIDTNTIKQITFDKNEHVINGTSVHRNEFGIVKGIFWSPKSNYLAFYHKDETMVTDYPIVNVEPIPAKLENIKYPMAGQTSHQVKVGVYNIKTDETVWLKTGEPLDHYLTCVTWSPDEKYIFIAILNRDQNHMQLNKYDISTGNKVKTLFEEKQDKYVEPEHQLIFLPNNNEKFLWFSRRDGWNHLYLYNTDGRLISQVTKGKWEVLSFNGFDKYGKNIFITATKKSPIEKQFYKVELSTSRIIQISKDKGVHRVLPNSGGTYFIDTYSNLTTPRITKILNNKGNTLSIIHRSGNPIKDYAVGNVKIFTIKNQDSTDLYCRMVFPPDFDASKKYPVIVYVYGGPHVQLVTNRWMYGRYSFWFYRMAQKGFIIFTLDNRGSANRGLAFEQATFRHLGTEEVKDQMVGVKYLKSLPYVDSTRFGVFGWSFGGFMTTSLMLRTNNAFKVGVGGGAVIDWRMYEVMYTERYMDTPEANPKGYEESSLLNYVQNLNGKLLLVHGTSDPTVVWQHTLKFAKKAADLDKPLDYFPYVGHHHGVVGKDALHLYNKITNYFLNNL